MQFNTLSEARTAGLIQLTEWCRHCDIEERYLEKEVTRIKQNKTRTTMLVKFGNHIALFVDDIAEKERRLK